VNEIVLSVPDVSCDHCVMAIESSVGEVAGVSAVAVDLAAKTVRVTGAPDAAAVLDGLEARARRQETPCGDGALVWREWGPPGGGTERPLVLFHGGSGSWRHWVRNITGANFRRGAVDRLVIPGGDAVRILLARSAMA
jgi:copper chaperone CopZ